LYVSCCLQLGVVRFNILLGLIWLGYIFSNEKGNTNVKYVAFLGHYYYVKDLYFLTAACRYPSAFLCLS